MLFPIYIAYLPFLQGLEGPPLLTEDASFLRPAPGG